MSGHQEAPSTSPKAQPTAAPPLAPFRVNRYKTKTKPGEAVRERPVGELVLFDDGSEAAGKAQSSAMRLAINYAEPDIAAGTAVFGLGLLGLPFLAHVNCLSLAPGANLGHVEGDGVFAYDAHVRRNAKKLISSYFDKRGLQRRFGNLDVAFLAKEIGGEQDDLDKRMSQAGEEAVRGEATQMQQWRSQVNGQVAVLQKRSACSFLGLPPEPSEVDVQKRYKKMAFELHPDKGGDHAKFKELQEMRDRLVEKRCDLDEGIAAPGESDCEDSEDWEEDSDEEARQARRQRRKKKREEKEEEEKRQADADVFNRRKDVREGLLRLWGSAETSREEISASSCVVGSSQPALNILREFIDRFVSTEVEVKDSMAEAEAEAKFQKFIKQGAEIIPVAAIIDADAAMSTLALHFNYRLLTRCSSAGIKARCSKLLEAAVVVPMLVKPFLQALSDLCTSRQERQRQARDLEAEAAAAAAEPQGATQTAQGAPKRRRICGKVQQSLSPDSAADGAAVAASAAAAGGVGPTPGKQGGDSTPPRAAARRAEVGPTPGKQGADSTPPRAVARRAEAQGRDTVGSSAMQEAKASPQNSGSSPKLRRAQGMGTVGSSAKQEAKAAAQSSGSSPKHGEKENVGERPQPGPKPFHRASKKTPAAMHMLVRLRSPSQPRAFAAKGRGRGAAGDCAAGAGAPRSFGPEDAAAAAPEDGSAKPLVEVQLQRVLSRSVSTKPVVEEAVAAAEDAERARMLRRTERLLQRLDDRERRRQRRRQGKASKEEAQKMETWARKWVSRKRRADSAE